MHCRHVSLQDHVVPLLLYILQRRMGSFNCCGCLRYIYARAFSCWSFLGTQVGPIRRHSIWLLIVNYQSFLGYMYIYIYICNIYISCCQSMFEVFERPLVVLKITQITQIICKWFSTARLDCWRIYWKGPFSGFCFGFVLFQCFNPNSCCPESQCPSENRRFFCWSNH